MTDGWPAWRTVKSATHLGCLAHARRMFTDALKGQKNKPSRPHHQGARVLPGAVPGRGARQTKLARGRDAGRLPLPPAPAAQRAAADAFKAWLDELAPKVLPKSLFGEAVGYCRRQWQYLIRYVDDGRSPVDNNVIERDIRPFATARKSWLFSDTVAGAKASAMVYSLMLTCRACGVEPYAWMLHV